ncbi:hypothetical protein BGZ94_002716 [Podila epigama]|nr:hypothetical protein BGZ94_002716 [Podila epigama]
MRESKQTHSDAHTPTQYLSFPAQATPAKDTIEFHTPLSQLPSSATKSSDRGDGSASCATISQLLDEAEEAPETTELAPKTHTQHSSPQRTVSRETTPSSSTTTSSSDSTGRRPATSTNRPLQAKNMERVPSINTKPTLQRERSLPLNMATEERNSLKVGDHNVSALQDPPQAHHLYSQSMNSNTPSAAPSMATEKNSPLVAQEPRSTSTSLSPSGRSPAKKRPHQIAVENLSPADFGYVDNVVPDRPPPKKAKTRSRLSLGSSSPPKPLQRSTPKRQSSFTSSITSSMLERRVEDIEEYVDGDLNGYESRLSY